MRKEAGYTLLELLVVLMIMALLISAFPGMALPVIAKIRFSGDVAEVESQLGADREKAVDTGQIVSVSASDLERNRRLKILIPNDKVIEFFPDGSSSANFVRIEQSGWKRSLVTDPVDGSWLND